MTDTDAEKLCRSFSYSRQRIRRAMGCAFVRLTVSLARRLRRISMSVLISVYLRLTFRSGSRLGLGLALACALLVGPLTVFAQATDSLTAAERAWLAEHPILRVAPDPDYPPVEFFDEQGRYQGIAAETLALLGKKLGIEFEIVQAESWDAVLEMAKAREIDLLSAAVPTPQRREYLQFTASMVEFPGVIIVRDEVTHDLTLKDLRGMQVAVVSGYVWQDYLQTDEPKIKLDKVPDLTTGLRKLSFGLVDAVVENLAIVSYTLEREGISNLRVAGETGYQASLALAVRNDWPELVQILDKGLALITPQERAKILARWVHLKQGRSAQEQTLWYVALAGLVVVSAMAGMVLIWNRSLRHQVHQRTLALQQAGGSLEQRVLERTAELEVTNAKLIKEMAARRRIEDDLRSFRSVLDQTLDCVFMFSADTMKFFYVNQGAIDQVLYSREELFAMAPFDIKPEFSEQRFRETIAPMLKGDVPSITFETLHRRKDGLDVPVEIFLQYVTPQDAEPLFVAIVRDITERRKIDRLKAEFISNVSHELRTPLTAIRGSLGLLAGGAVGALTGPVADLVQVAARNSERLSALVNDILDLEKLEVGKLELFLERCSIVDLVRQSLEDNRSYADRFGVSFELQPPSTDFHVNADRMRIAQVMANLLSNAAKFSAVGGRVIVRVLATANQQAARVEVEDHGIGISDSYKPYVFDKFSQDDTSDMRSSYGSGLGLNISKGIVERHQGSIGFTSTQGQGSCFYFELPMSNGVVS